PSTEHYTLSLHSALPICRREAQPRNRRETMDEAPLPSQDSRSWNGECAQNVLDRALLRDAPSSRDAGTPRETMARLEAALDPTRDRKSTRLNSSHSQIP